MVRDRLVITASAIGIAALTACAGGGRSALPTVSAPSVAAVVPSQPSALKVTLRIPAAGANASARQPAYVSPSTNGVAITVYPAIATPPPGPTLVADVSASSPNCTNNPDGSRNCQLSVQAPIGNDFFIVTTYDQVPSGGVPQGAQLSTATLQYQVRSGQVNTLPLTLNGIIATVVLGPTGYLVPASPQTLTLYVSAKDADGNFIIGPGNYSSPINLAISGDPNSTTTLSATQVSAPATSTVTINYNGGPIGTVTIAGSAPGAISGTATLQRNTAGTNVALLVPGQIGRLNIAVAPAGGNTFTISALAYDSLGNPIAGPFATAVNVTATNGSLSAGSLWNSSASVTFTNVTGAATVTIASGPLSASAQLPLTSVTQYPIPIASSNPFVLTNGPDGAIWFNMLGPFQLLDINMGLYGGNNANLGRIDMTGAITTWPFSSPVAQPIGITTGPDGALWIGEQNVNKVARVTTAGQFTEYPVPTASAGPRAIVTGPDGALWFTELRKDKIGRITTAGAITEYPIPRPSPFSQNPPARPSWIANGSDGALWFTEQRRSAIGRMTTAGVYTEMPTPRASAFPRFITPNADGNLYFSELGPGNYGEGIAPPSPNAAIARITPAGQTTEFFPPSPYAVPDAIVSGPDGALWFVDLNFGALERMTTSGQFTMYPMAPNGAAAPDGLVFGPDGNLWFGDINSNFIGRFALAAGWLPMPPALNILGTGDPVYTQYLTIAETGNSGPFTVSSANTAVATVAPASGYTAAYTVSGVAAGTTAISIVDAHGRAATVPVTVSIATGTIQSHHRRAAALGGTK